MNPERVIVWSKAAAASAAAAALLILLVAMAVAGWKLRAAPDNLLAATGDIQGLMAQIRKDYRDPKDPTKGLYWDIAASLTASTETSRITLESVQDVRAALVGGKDSLGVARAGVFPTIELLVGDLRGVAQELKLDLRRLTDSTDETLQPLRTSLERIAVLIETLDGQAKTNGKQAEQTLTALARAIEDFDRLLRDPNIAQTLANVEGITAHGDSSMESIDIALQPWRKKASQLKFILGKLAGFFRVVLPL
jgi:Ser/Thr protein kinase RdoA (MazF antagonist)